VADVAEHDQVEPGFERRGEHVAREETKPRLQACVRDGLPRHRQHFGQVKRRDVARRVRRGERDAPGGRPHADVEHITGRMRKPLGDTGRGLPHEGGERADDHGV
jgi:hypothetical protein